MVAFTAPSSDHSYQVICGNGYVGMLSADALGIRACLYTFSHLSISNNKAFAEVCTNHYQRLLEIMLEHKESN